MKNLQILVRRFLPWEPQIQQKGAREKQMKNMKDAEKGVVDKCYIVSLYDDSKSGD